MLMGAVGSDKAILAIMTWSDREEWRDRRETVVEDHLGPVSDALELTPDEIVEAAGDRAIDQIVAFAFEDFLTCDFEPDQQNVVDDYLKRRGWKESAPVKRYLRALRHSVVSLYEVTETVPGSHFRARDLVRGGEPVRIEDKLASESLVRWDRLAARLLPIGGRTYLSAGVLWLAFDDARGILDQIAKLRASFNREIGREARRHGILRAALGALPVEDAILSELTPLFSQTWLTTAVRQARVDPSSNATNFDGEALAICEARFPLAERGRAGDIEARLDTLTELSRDAPERLAWAWLSQTLGSSSDGESDASRKGAPSVSDQDGDRILGLVQLDANALLLQTNSVERAARGCALLSQALGPLVGAPLTSIETLKQSMASARTPEAAPMGQAELPFLPEGGEAALRQVLDRHYRETLTSPLPMLGGRTPKQAVRSKAGREQVVTWLKYLENQDVHRAQIQDEPAYDFTWIWDALGIAHLRQ
jgi:hypothetical protein